MKHPTPHQTIMTTCPSCQKAHDVHPELGVYCSFRCLTAAVGHIDPGAGPQPGPLRKREAA